MPPFCRHQTDTCVVCKVNVFNRHKGLGLKLTSKEKIERSPSLHLWKEWIQELSTPNTALTSKGIRGSLVWSQYE